MESTPQNRKSREQVARMVERAFDGTTLAAGEDAVRELKEGGFNAAYHVRLAGGREVILKIAPPGDADLPKSLTNRGRNGRLRAVRTKVRVRGHRKGTDGTGDPHDNAAAESLPTRKGWGQ